MPRQPARRSKTAATSEPTPPALPDFISRLGHELRTPLAVLRIHAQNALEAPDAGDREEALRQLGSGVDRATRVVALGLLNHIRQGKEPRRR